MSENEKKEAGLGLDKEVMSKILDSTRKMLEEDLLFLQTSPHGLKLSMNRHRFEKEFSDLKIESVTDVVQFVAKYVHFQTCHDMESFYLSYTDDDRETAEKLVEIIRSHPNSPLLIFRSLRRANLLSGDVESHLRTIRFAEKKELSADYYDISIPFINEEGEDTVIRMELDRIELENLVASLAKPLKMSEE